MNDQDRELASWKDEWQALGGRDGLAADLASRVVADTRSIRRKVVIEVAAAAFSTSLSLFFIARGHGDVVGTIGSVGILVFNAVWLTRLFTLRERESRDTGTVEATVALLRRRRDDDLRWNRFARHAMVVLGIGIVPWAIATYVAHAAAYRAEPWRAVVGFGGAALILVVVFVLNEVRRKKLERERLRFERLVEERLLP